MAYRAYNTALVGTTAVPGHDEIDVAAAACGTAQPPRPIRHGETGSVARDLLADFGLALMAAGFAPHD